MQAKRPRKGAKPITFKRVFETLCGVFLLLLLIAAAFGAGMGVIALIKWIERLF